MQIGTIDRPRGAGAGIAVHRTETEHDHDERQWDCHDVSQENGAALQERGTDCDPSHGATAIRTDGEVSSRERAIALSVIVGRLVDGTRGTWYKYTDVTDYFRHKPIVP